MSVMRTIPCWKHGRIVDHVLIILKLTDNLRSKEFFCDPKRNQESKHHQCCFLIREQNNSNTHKRCSVLHFHNLFFSFFFSCIWGLFDVEFKCQGNVVLSVQRVLQYNPLGTKINSSGIVCNISGATKMLFELQTSFCASALLFDQSCISVTVH